MMTLLTSPAIAPAKNEQTSQQTHERRKLLTVLGSGLSGTTIEFYDLFTYGTAPALVSKSSEKKAGWTLNIMPSPTE